MAFLTMSPMWNGCKFGPARLLSVWRAPQAAGIYAISDTVGKANGSRVRRLLYFGQSTDLSSRGIGPDHGKYRCWRRHAAGPLCVSVHLEDNPYLRLVKERRLIKKYALACNAATHKPLGPR